MILNFLTPPPPKKKGWGGEKISGQKWQKIKVVPNFLKWRDNWSKMIFWFFDPPPPKKKFSQKWQKSKLFQITWNGKKIGRNWFLDFLATSPSKMNIYIEYLEKCLSILFTCPPPLSPPQAKSWHGEVWCSHSAHLTQPCCDFFLNSPIWVINGKFGHVLLNHLAANWSSCIMKSSKF